MPLRVTILQPDPAVPADRLGPWLSSNGLLLRAVSLWKQELPALDHLGAGLIVLGGRMNSHDTEAHSWIDPLKKLLTEAVEREMPVLAICLGHHLLAEAFGGRVQVDHPAGLERGPVTVAWHPEGRVDPVLGRLARAGRTVLAQSHRDAVVELPGGAVSLAETERYPNQAFRVGSAVGVQFHPEASPDLVAAWAHAEGVDPLYVRRSMRLADGEIAHNGRLMAAAFAQQVKARAADR